MKFSKLLTGLIFVTSFAFSQVNINTASLDELSALRGIGQKKAKAIIKYRKTNGSFKSTADLQNVNGIGEGIFNKIGSDVKVTGKTDVTKIKGKKITQDKTKKSTKKTKKTKKKSSKK